MGVSTSKGMNMNRLLITLVVVLLSACGGGGDVGDAEPDVQSPGNCCARSISG